MRRFILEIVIFTLISMFCFSVFGQNWQDENMVWDEEKGKWVVTNKAHGRVNVGEEKGEKTRNRPYDHLPWGKYLSKNVRYGNREPSAWEISEAQRKLWAKSVLHSRAAKKSAERRSLMASRKSSGWYHARYVGVSNHSWPMQVHVGGVMSYRYGY